MCELMLTHLRLLTRNNCKVLSNFSHFLIDFSLIMQESQDARKPKTIRAKEVNLEQVAMKV